ncbi:MAG: AGE family epimerase/isomerase [Bacteroidales bacterium]|nr:AGE family epimerase/isomerase [Bacteroidales bacterium]
MMGTEEFLQDVKACLTDNILPYWLAMKDPRGGFHGEAGADGAIHYDAPRGVILNARIIWAFAAAYRELHTQKYLIAAIHACDWFLQHFCDHRYGGVYWSISPDGIKLDSKKQLYAQGFAIYGLSELYKVDKDDSVLRNAINLYKVVETFFADREHGGYTEALARDFTPLDDMSLSEHDINADKTMNSHLHLLEAYANLYEVWPDEGLKGAIKRLLDIIGTRIMGPDGHLRLYFNRDWSVLPGGVSYGHDIETSWLALECAFALKDIDTINSVRSWAHKLAVAGNEGLLPDGSMRYERLTDGSYDDSRQWWVQAEAVVGNLWMWKYHSDASGASRAIACWEYIRDHLLDREGGEWWWAVLPDGSVDTVHPKAGFWKCPYHNTRMCLQMISLFR